MGDMGDGYGNPAGTAYIEEYCPAHFEDAEEGEGQGHFFGAIRGVVSDKLPPPENKTQIPSSTPIKNGSKSDLSTSKNEISKNGSKSELSTSKNEVSKNGSKSDLSTSKNDFSNKIFLNKFQAKRKYPDMRGDDLNTSHPPDIKDHSGKPKK